MATGSGSVAAAIAAAQAGAAGQLGDGNPLALPSNAAMPPATDRRAGLGAQLPAGLAAELTPSPAGEEDLLRLIDQQPDEMAVLLRGWLADRRS